MTQLSDPNHPWVVGDICTCEYQGIAGGVLYVVTEVAKHGTGGMPNNHMLKIKPVYGMFQDISTRKVRTISSSWCTPLSLVTLGAEYAKLGTFIRDIAIRRGSECLPET